VAQSFGNLTKGIIGTLVLAKGKSMFKKLIGLLRDEAAATAIEYALIAALVSVAAVTVLSTVGSNLTGTFSTVARKL
jgi:pilus assembly protein Flp/PilA